MSKFNQAAIAAASTVALFGGALTLIAPAPAEAYPVHINMYGPSGHGDMVMPNGTVQPVWIHDMSMPDDGDDFHKFYETYLAD